MTNKSNFFHALVKGCSFLLIAILITSTNTAFTQKPSKEYKKSFKEAGKKLDMGDYYGAVTLFNALLPRTEPTSVEQINYNIGVCYFHLKDYVLANKYFEEVSYEKIPGLFYYKGILTHLNRDFDQAIELYEKYKKAVAVLDVEEREHQDDEIDKLIKTSLYAEIAIKNEENITIENVGPTINTKYNEYVPLISADESMMLFTSRRPGNLGGLDPTNTPFEDIYVSYNERGAWSSPKQLREGINTIMHDACVGLSADAQTLFVYRTNEDDILTGDLYESKMGLDDWEDLTKLEHGINSKYTETSASISPDDRVIYFSSNRSGGYGGKDIYKIEILPNGEWSKVLNLGPTINTPYDEDAPFIHSDRKTLYFSSKGNDKNMGGYDIFESKVNDKGEWSNPKNLGYPINTVKDDIFFVLAADGKTGYYSSSKERGYGGQDIYRINFNDQNKQLHVLKGVVYSNDSIPLQATITLIENESKNIQGIYNSKGQTGKFILLVIPEKTYSVIVESDDYHSYISELFFDITGEEILEFRLDEKE